MKEHNPKFAFKGWCRSEMRMHPTERKLLKKFSHKRTRQRVRVWLKSQ